MRVLAANPVVVIPADNRRLVEQALYPEALAAITANADAVRHNAVRDGDGWRFRLGGRSFRYDRWELASGV